MSTHAANEVMDLLARLSVDLASPGMRAAMAAGGEKSLQMLVRASIDDGYAESWLAPAGYRTGDTVVFEFPVRCWRADMVIFHMSGDVTVVEMKDGARGGLAVLSGIGQCGLYASIIGMSMVGRRKVQRALMWTRAGSHESDEIDSEIGRVCIEAGVKPLFMPSVDEILKVRLGAIVSGVCNGAA